jgi:hypothetical protein
MGTTSDSVTAPVPTTGQPQEPAPAPSIGIDEAFLNPPADPGGYEVTYRDERGEPITELSPELRAMDADVRAWAHIAQVPGTELSALADLVQMPGEVQTPQECMAFLHAKWGVECEERLETARAYVREVETKRPGLTRFLEASGLGDSPRFIMAVERLARSRAGRKR